MKEIFIQLKALGVIRFVLYYLLVALEFVLNLPYTTIRTDYMAINSICNRTNKYFVKERIILLLKNRVIKEFLYKCKEDYKHYIKDKED